MSEQKICYRCDAIAEVVFRGYAFCKAHSPVHFLGLTPINFNHEMKEIPKEELIKRMREAAAKMVFTPPLAHMQTIILPLLRPGEIIQIRNHDGELVGEWMGKLALPYDDLPEPDIVIGGE